MCVSCGCGKINEDHDDERNLTMRDLEEAAKASESSVNEVVENLREAAQGAGGGSPEESAR